MTRTLALLNSVCHDLRNPLASIKVSVGSLLDPEVAWDDEERREFLTMVDQTVDRLSRLVQHVLTMSRIEADALQPDLVETSLPEAVAYALRVDGAAETGAVRIDLDVPESLPAVLADPVQLDQVLANLLDNARRYAPGPIAVEATATPDDVVLRIVDHGPGISPPERERVFDQFYRLNRGGPRPEGTGLGLAICRGIIEAAGGSIRVETTPGGGATFVVVVPRADRATTLTFEALALGTRTSGSEVRRHPVGRRAPADQGLPCRSGR